MHGWQQRLLQEREEKEREAAARLDEELAHAVPHRYYLKADIVLSFFSDAGSDSGSDGIRTTTLSDFYSTFPEQDKPRVGGWVRNVLGMTKREVCEGEKARSNDPVPPLLIRSLMGDVSTEDGKLLFVLEFRRRLSEDELREVVECFYGNVSDGWGENGVWDPGMHDIAWIEFDQESLHVAGDEPATSPHPAFSSEAQGPEEGTLVTLPGWPKYIPMMDDIKRHGADAVFGSGTTSDNIEDRLPRRCSEFERALLRSAVRMYSEQNM